MSIKQIRKGDKYIIKKTHHDSNPYNHIRLRLNTHTRNPSGNGHYKFRIGDIITYDRDNAWDLCYFLTPDGEDGKMEGNVQRLLDGGIIEKY